MEGQTTSKLSGHYLVSINYSLGFFNLEQFGMVDLV